MGAARAKSEWQRNAIRVCGNWSEQMSSKGKIYFYNCVTEVSQWQKPPEWSLPDLSRDELLRSLRNKESVEARCLKRTHSSHYHKSRVDNADNTKRLKTVNETSNNGSNNKNKDNQNCFRNNSSDCSRSRAQPTNNLANTTCSNEDKSKELLNLVDSIRVSIGEIFDDRPVRSENLKVNESSFPERVNSHMNANTEKPSNARSVGTGPLLPTPKTLDSTSTNDRCVRDSNQQPRVTGLVTTLMNWLGAGDQYPPSPRIANSNYPTSSVDPQSNKNEIPRHVHTSQDCTIRFNRNTRNFSSSGDHGSPRNLSLHPTFPSKSGLPPPDSSPDFPVIGSSHTGSQSFTRSPVPQTSVANMAVSTTTPTHYNSIDNRHLKSELLPNSNSTAVYTVPCSASPLPSSDPPECSPLRDGSQSSLDQSLCHILDDPSLQTYFDPNLIARFRDPTLERLELESNAESKKSDRLQSLLYSELSVESKKLRALVRISEAKLALHKEKQTSLQALMQSIESRKQPSNPSFSEDVI